MLVVLLLLLLVGSTRPRRVMLFLGVRSSSVGVDGLLSSGRTTALALSALISLDGTCTYTGE